MKIKYRSDIVSIDDTVGKIKDVLEDRLNELYEMTAISNRYYNNMATEQKRRANFITLTEVYLTEQKEAEAKVSVKPADIVCIKEVSSTKFKNIKTSVFIANFTNPCQGFNFDGPILVKETKDEVEDLIAKFYEDKKRKT